MEVEVGSVWRCVMGGGRWCVEVDGVMGEGG